MTTNRFATRSADISVIGVVLVAGLVGGVLAAKTLDWAINGGALQALSVRPFAAGEQTAWFLSRASAIVAYLLLSGSMIWGLALSTKVVRDLVAPPLAAAMHSSLSWTAAGMAAFHAAVLLFDGYYHYTVADLLVPFVGPYRPVVVGLGIISLYGLFLVSASFAARKWIGHKTWRRLHYLTFVFYVLVTAHGLLAGTDSSQTNIQILYVGSVLVVLFLTNYRILSAARPHRSSDPANRQLIGERTVRSRYAPVRAIPQPVPVAHRADNFAQTQLSRHPLRRALRRRRPNTSRRAPLYVPTGE